jgi:hypothetical protein
MRENTLSGTVVEAAIAPGRITVVDITRQAAEGTICGGEGSSHKGSHYTNPRTGDHYGRHQPGWPSHIRTPCAATPPSLWRFQDLGVWEARAVPHILMPPSKIAETIRNEKKILNRSNPVIGKAIRIAPARNGVLAAFPWKFLANQNDIYVVNREIGDITKISIHESGKIYMHQGATSKLLTPPVRISGGVWMHLLQIGFFLSACAGRL